MPTARRVRVALFVCQLIAAIALLACPWNNALAQPQSPPTILSVEPRPSRSTFNAINGLTAVTLQTSRALQTPANSIRVWDRGTEVPSNLYTVTPGSTPTELVIQFNPRVMYGRLTIVLTPAVTDANGASLDGECLDPFQPTFPSGDGRAGGDFVLQYDVLAGDFNHDRCVGISDLADFLNALFNNDFAADVNNSGLVNVQDIFEFLGAFLTNQNIVMVPLDGGRPVAASLTPPESATLRTDLTDLQVTFSEPVGNLLLGASTIALSDEAGLVYRPSTASLATDRLSATFTFAPGVPPCHRYRVSLSNSIQDLSGEPLLGSTPTPELTGLRPPPSPVLDPLPRSTTANTISISGIADAGAQIEVAGPGGMVSGPVTASGAFAVELPLVANRVNSLFVSSVSTCGIRSAPTPVAVAQDTQAPTLAIDFPSPNAQIQAIGTDVAGRVGDLLSGFQGLTVTVNGQPAAVNVGNVDNGTFFFPSLLLNDTVPTQIQVVASDALGNTTTRTISVSKLVIPPGSPRMEIFSGNGQSTTVGSLLPSPVIIRMLRGDGTAFSGKVVTFNVTRSDGQLAGTPGATGGLVYQTITDAGGFARVYWTLGSDAGSGNNRVEVTSRDIAGTIQLCASSLARPARQINFGDAMSLNQIGEAGAALPVPLSVFVSDGQNGSGGVPVTFQVIRGGGGFGSPSSASITVDTDPSGRASAIFTLGTEGGQNEVEATFPGNPGLPVVFTARGLVRELVTPTTFVGELFDNAGRPIGGCPVTLAVNGLAATPGMTGPDGRFTISQGLIGGTGTIMFVADQATQLNGQPIPAGSFPIMAYDNVLVVPNAENSLAMAVRLPQLNPNNRRTYDGSQDVILGIEGVEGVAFKIRAGTVVRTMQGVTASPATPITLSLDQVHFDEVPMPLPNGAAIPFAWTLQPKNATFDPPIEVTLPNFAALPPGSVTYIQQFNHIVGGFENVGAAKVSADGSVVVSDPGAGIYQAGWGGFTPPPPPTGDIEHYDVKIGVDGNGDGIVSLSDADATSATKPYQFWANTDNEVQETMLFPDCPRLQGSDSSDLIIASSRDLEDMFPLSISVPRDALSLAQAGYQLQLSTSAGLRIHVFKAVAENTLYLTDPSAALVQTGSQYGGVLSPQLRPFRAALTDANLFQFFTLVDFPANLANFLVEFTEPGDGIVTATLLSPAGQVVGSSSVFVRAFDIKDMYEQVFATPTAGFSPPQSATAPQVPTVSFDVRHRISTDFTIAHPEDNIVFVHGFWMSDCDYTEFSETMFKRLWWSGYRGRFSSLRWPCLGDPFRFNESDFRAFKYAASLRQYVEQDLRVRHAAVRVHLAAHSEGNVLASEALRSGLSVDSYVLMQAAVPAACYGGSPPSFPEFASAEATIRTFDALAADVRLGKGWTGYFEDIPARANVVANFFNAKDAVLQTGVLPSTTSTSWRGNNRMFKPDSWRGNCGSESDAAYLQAYSFRSTEPGTGAYFFGGDRCDSTTFERRVTDDHEILSQAVRSLTKAAGAERATGHSVWRSFDLEAACGFTDAYRDHSGQFNLDIQNVGPFYAELLSTCNTALYDNRPVTAPPAVDQQWTMSVAGRTTTADASGSFQLRGVPVTNQVMRVRGSSPDGYAISEQFLLAPNEQRAIQSLILSQTPFPSPATVRLSGPAVTAPGANSQLVLTGAMSDGSIAPLTARSSGSTYISSNPAVASVSQDGLVTGHSLGIAFLTAINDAATASRRIDVVQETFETTLRGVVVRGDTGAVVGGATVSILGLQQSSLSRSDGSFEIPLAYPSNVTSVSITATATIAGQPWVATSGTAVLVPGVSTDVGLISLCRLQPGAWSSQFGLPGLNGSVYAMAVFDDGTGNALYVGGDFTQADGITANRIARWNGSEWSSLGSGAANGVGGAVFAMAAYGGALYVGGEFNTAGGVAASRIARWNGSVWVSMGGGVSTFSGITSVNALAVYDDGTGEKLYVGGSFDFAGALTVNNVAAWNGTSWSALGTGVSAPTGESVDALAVYDDGGGPGIYAAGSFTAAGGLTANNVARWRGGSWSRLGTAQSNGVTGIPALTGRTRVFALTTFNDGSGNALVLGGYFATAGSTTANSIARWNGTAWSSLGSGARSTIYALAPLTAGGVSTLYVGGEFTSIGGVAATRVARWSGSAWSTLADSGSEGLGGVFASGAFAMRSFDDGSGLRLYIGGRYSRVANLSANSLARWSDTGWSRLGDAAQGITGTVTVIDSSVDSLISFDDGSGPAMYVGGNFTTVGSVRANSIARWDGARWTRLGSETQNGVNSTVAAMAVFDDGSGPALFVAGSFSSAGGVPARSIARWDGSHWSSLGTGSNNGVSGTITTVAVFNDGRGEALFAGGNFTAAGGTLVRNLARWDGTTWTAVGGAPVYGIDGDIYAMCTFRDGSGTGLYVGGYFSSAGGISVNNIARWSGSTWTSLGSGLSNGIQSTTVYPVGAMTVHDDGTGDALYVTGRFTLAGGLAANNIARWNGASWSTLGSGVSGGGYPSAITSFNDGTGPSLCVSGSSLSVWKGSTWAVAGTGPTDGVSDVYALASYSQNGESALFAGGYFTVAGSLPSLRIAKWTRVIDCGSPIIAPPHGSGGDDLRTADRSVVVVADQADGVSSPDFAEFGSGRHFDPDPWRGRGSTIDSTGLHQKPGRGGSLRARSGSNHKLGPPDRNDSVERIVSVPIPVARTCVSDFNRSGPPPTVQDLYDFMDAYLASDSRADMDRSGQVDAADLTAFVTEYIAGCP